MMDHDGGVTTYLRNHKKMPFGTPNCHFLPGDRPTAGSARRHTTAGVLLLSKSTPDNGIGMQGYQETTVDQRDIYLSICRFFTLINAEMYMEFPPAIVIERG